MRERPARLPLADNAALLSWEDLGRQPSSRAFWDTLRELLFSPARFFDRMATSGGLREPLSFLWIVAAAAVVIAFPLALSYFALTAPNPLDVSTEVYNRHLLAPRVAGFAVVLLPVVLVLVGVLAALTGSLFYLGARLFGARGWEGSVSIWCYAHCGGAALLAGGEALACAVSIGSYLMTLAWPSTAHGAGSVVRVITWCLGGVGTAGGFVIFVRALAVGCTHTFRLEAAVGTAAALAGLLLAALLSGGPALGLALWGRKAGLVALAGAAALATFLALLARAYEREARAHEASAGTA